ncbi:hypothetical protein CSC19_2771 [Enterobacter hormaechei]|nr:hypothetical protein CSC19_2771 [Enterobacter hormaechei]
MNLYKFTPPFYHHLNFSLRNERYLEMSLWFVEINESAFG